VKEFEKELAVLKGRVDSLEAKVGELEATQFSTTTKLKGIATFMLGANSFTGTNSGGQYAGVANTTAFNQATYGATTFNYDVRLNFDTSFTGKDLLRTTLRAANAAGANGSAYGVGPMSQAEAFFEQPSGDNAVGINRLFYNFPMGQELSLSAGALIRTDDAGMLGIWPSVYPADTVLDFFTYAGVPGAYNLNGLGAGAGFVYSPKGIKGLTISQNYVAAEGSAYANNGVMGNAGSGNPENGGVWTSGSGGVAVTQVGYAGEKTPLIGGSYAIAFAYTYSQNVPLPTGTPLAQQYSDFNSGANGYSSGNNYGLSGYWKPEKAGLIPSISWGFGGGSYNVGAASYQSYTALAGFSSALSLATDGGNTTSTKGITIASWSVGLQWDDAFVKGNAAGMAVGQSPFVTQRGSMAAGTPGFQTASSTKTGGSGSYDANYMWEWWYKFQVTDNISITPALYYISNFNGQLGQFNASTGGAQATSNNLFGGLLKTTFKF